MPEYSLRERCHFFSLRANDLHNAPQRVGVAATAEFICDGALVSVSQRETLAQQSAAGVTDYDCTLTIRRSAESARVRPRWRVRVTGRAYEVVRITPALYARSEFIQYQMQSLVSRDV